MNPIDTATVAAAGSVVENLYVILSSIVAIAGIITSVIARRRIKSQKQTIKNIGQRLGDKI